MVNIEDIEATINHKYHLVRQDKDWLLDDSAVRVRALNKHSFGFSLDKSDKSLEPFGFFSGNPPKNMKKMCDAIVIQLHSGKLYIVLVEEKTSNKDEYRKQLINGKLFCKWLIALFEEHGYGNFDPTYVGLLVWEPRSFAPNKGVSTHQLSEYSRVSESCRLFEIRNKSQVYLSKLFDVLI